MRKLRQILTLRQNSLSQGFKFSSESKLFGGRCLRVRATSATLVRVAFFELVTVNWRLSKTPRWRWWRRCRPPGGVHLLHLRRAQHPAQTGRQLGLWNKPGPSIMLQNPNYPTLRCWIFTISCPTLQQFYRISGKKSFETGRVYWIHQVVETKYVDYSSSGGLN